MVLPTKTFSDAGLDWGFVVSEPSNNRIAREQGLLGPSAERVRAGTVIGVVTAGGLGKPLATGASDGTQNAVKILGRGEPASTTNRRVAYMTGPGVEVNGNLLTWPAGITAEQKAAAEAQLAAKGIKVRY